jgi:hypothetical protein
MPTLEPTEMWTGKEYSPFLSAQRAFICPGYADEGAAINAVFGRFGCRPGTPHRLNPALFATNGVQARTQDGPTTWIVIVPYSYLQGAQSQGSDLEPLLRPTRYLIEPGISSELVDVDAYGNAYTTSAGFPFDEQHYRPFRSLRITATRYYPNYDIALGLKYMNKINLTPVNIKSLGTVQKGQMYCEFIGPTSEIILTQPAPIEVKHVFEIRGPLVSGAADDPSFRYRRLDAGRQGWYQDSSSNFQPEDFSSPDPSRSNATYKYYRSRTAPTPLNGAGQPIDNTVKLGEGISPKTPVNPPNNRKLAGSPSGPERKLIGNYYYLLFTEFNTIDFGPLLAGL